MPPSYGILLQVTRVLDVSSLACNNSCSIGLLQRAVRSLGHNTLSEGGLPRLQPLPASGRSHAGYVLDGPSQTSIDCVYYNKARVQGTHKAGAVPCRPQPTPTPPTVCNVCFTCHAIHTGCLLLGEAVRTRLLRFCPVLPSCLACLQASCPPLFSIQRCTRLIMMTQCRRLSTAAWDS